MIILLILLIILIMLNVPIAFALGISVLAVLLLEGFPLTLVPQRLFVACDSYILLAVPLFVLAGEIMTEGGLSTRLVNFIDRVVGAVRGKLEIVAIVASAFFAAISGSGAATVAAIGGAMYPEMTKRGYERSRAAAILASGGPLGVLIPPSIPMIVYGALTDTSITELFFAGLIPGVMVAIFLIVYIHHTSPTGLEGKRSSRKEIASSFKDGMLALLMPIIILGGIYGGVFTPTESAAVAAFYALVVCILIYRKMRLKEFLSSFSGAVLTTSMIMLLIATASLFSWVLTIENVPQTVSTYVLNFSSNPYVFLLLVNIIFLFLGVFLDTTVAILLVTPIVFPIAMSLGINPVHLGVIITFNLALGQLTPPFGICTITSASVCNVPFEDVAKKSLPLLGMYLLCLMVITYIPQISIWLPSVLFD